MSMSEKENKKQEFQAQLTEFVDGMCAHISMDDGQWTIKGFIDVYKNIYTISSDTKIVSKILEIHLFPEILKFANKYGYKIVLAEHQNYYPDITFISKKDEKIKFAVDFKTTYSLQEKKDYCNGFTLGSHGEYFTNRKSTKNIQFPYESYIGHFCLGIIYSRHAERLIDETKTYRIDELQSIASVVKDFQFFVAEKWRIASDKGGSGNTANIGSINYIPDILNGKGMFHLLGEHWFDDYWMNFGKILAINEDGKTKKITNLVDFIKYRGGDVNLLVKKFPKSRKKS